MNHAAFVGAGLHQTFHYIGENDPGAVGAGLTWLKKSAKQISYRNDANTGWTTILASTDVLALSSGADWQDLLDARDNIDPGDTIRIPNDILVQESSIQVDTPFKLLGSGPLSTIKLVEDVSMYGGSVSWVIYGVDGFEIANLTIEHDRATVDRCIALSIHENTRNIFIHDVVFKNISSTCVIIRPNWDNQVGIGFPAAITEDILITRCTADEWYEAFVEMREGVSRRIGIINNTCNVSAAHPDGGVSRPQGICLNIEEYNGHVEYLTVAGNKLINTMANKWTTLGMLMQWEDAVGDKRHKYNHISMRDNDVTGWEVGFHMSMLNHGLLVFPGPCYADITGNRFTLNTAKNIALTNVIGYAEDNVVIADNDIAVLGAATAIEHVNDVPPYDVTVTQVANRIT